VTKDEAVRRVSFVLKQLKRENGTNCFEHTLVASLYALELLHLDLDEPPKEIN
jgi:hypothetical protein